MELIKQDTNEFESNSAVVPMSAGMVAAAAREQHEVQAAIISAKKFPRDERQSYERIIKSFSRAGLAEDAVWSFPRGGSRVEGPSVQCARELARCWGNLSYGLRVVDIDDTYCHIKGRAVDLETNTCVEAEDKFEKKIPRRNRATGVTEWVSPDERDLRELVNRRGAILVRNCILQVMPPDVIEDAVSQAKKTLQLKASNQLKENKEETIKVMIGTFARYGVNVAMLQDYLGHSLDLVTPEQIAELRSIAVSLKDGNSRREEVFNVKPRGSGSDELNGKPVDTGGDIEIE